MPKYNGRIRNVGVRFRLGKDFFSGILLGLVLGLSVSTLGPSRILLTSVTEDQALFGGGGVGEKIMPNALLGAIDEKDRRIASLERDCISGGSRSPLVDSPPVAEQSKGNDGWKGRFPVKGTARVEKQEFAKVFDLGLPANPAKEQTEVLLLYTREQSIPPSLLQGNGESAAGPVLSVEDATSNCETLSIISIDPDDGPRNVGTSCLALVRDYPMYHIPRFIKNQSKDFELRMRDLLLKEKGAYTEYTFEKEEDETPTLKHREFLNKYLTHFDAIKSKLAPILKRIAVDSTIVIMVCNFGQSALVLNFACACRARGISTANWLVFATDPETVKIVESLEITAFHDKDLFGHVPTEAAGAFRDQTFTNVVTAKVAATHLVSSLGYDLLYQDVDLIWYRDPIRLFSTDRSLSKFDIMFAHDGGRGVYFYPYALNTGLFFARHNARTRHLFRSWLFAMDIAWRMDDQVAMNTILPEEVSYTGLKAKVLEGYQFPSGFHFHSLKHRAFMNQLTANKTDSYTFHMNWNQNHVEKVQYMKQMGIWYAREDCIGSEGVKLPNNGKPCMDNCCSVSPLHNCYFSDLPSFVPCPDSPRKRPLPRSNSGAILGGKLRVGKKALSGGVRGQ